MIMSVASSISIQRNVCVSLVKKFGAKSGLRAMDRRGMFSSMTGLTKSKKVEPFTVYVEGNIGSGKTTLLNHFATLDSVTTFAEPVDRWRDVRGHNLLDLMYKDPSRWSLTFQTYVQLTMLRIHTQPVNSPIRMIERSIHSARNCFVENLHTKGLISEPDFAVLDEWFQWISKNHNVSGNLFVYLRTTPEVVHKRMLARARMEESCVPIEYLQELHELHENWLYYGTKFTRTAPVLVIDANQDFDSMKKEFLNCEREIRKEMMRLSTNLTPSSPGKLALSPAFAKSSVV